MNLIGSGLIPRGLPQGGLLKTAGVLLFVCVWSATASPKDEANGIHGVAGTLGINHTADEETALLQEVFSYMEFLESEDTQLLMQERKKHIDHKLNLAKNRVEELKKARRALSDKLTEAKDAAFKDLGTITDLENKVEDITYILNEWKDKRSYWYRQHNLIKNILQALEDGLIDIFVNELRGLAEIHTGTPGWSRFYEKYFDAVTKQARHIRQIDGALYLRMLRFGDLPSKSEYEANLEVKYLTFAKVKAVFELSQFSVSEYVSAFYICSPEIAIERREPSLSYDEEDDIPYPYYLCLKYGFAE